MRAVRFNRYGDLDELHVAQAEEPQPGRGEVSVRVLAAGLNPGENAIRSGAMHEISPAHFPEGQGTDLAGVVQAKGRDVTGVQIGDEVVGWSDRRGAQAERAVLPAENTLPKPDGMAFDQAAVLPTVGATAVSALRALAVKDGETLVVAGASGGVGSVLVQLAVRAGARVIGTASEPKQEHLRSLGAEPVAYGDGVLERLRAAAPGGVDAFADCHGDGNIDLAVELGVPEERINTIIDFEAAERVGTKTQGMYQLDDLGKALQPVVALVASDELQVPIEATFPLKEVREAYVRMNQAETVGKVLLRLTED